MPVRVHKLPSGTFNTRRNLPARVGRKRGESNFLRAFERAYFGGSGMAGMASGEFALSGYGVADLVWIAWRPDPAEQDFSAVSLEKQLSRRKLFAFEAKLTDWRRALQQAFRYRYFADKSVVVMPLENARAAVANLEAFQSMEVGLWTFDQETGTIKKHYTPVKSRALNSGARAKAIALLSSKLNLGKLRKQFEGVAQSVQMSVV